MVPPPGIRIPKLRLDSNGGWHIDGERIEHARTLSVLTANLRLAEDGTFTTSIGRETAPCEVDDVGFFVTAAGVADAGLVLALSDGSEETLTTPELESGERLYVRVKSGRAWASFKSAAYQSLAEHFVEMDGRFGLVVCERFVAVAVSPPWSRTCR